MALHCPATLYLAGPDPGAAVEQVRRLTEARLAALYVASRGGDPLDEPSYDDDPTYDDDPPYDDDTRYDDLARGLGLSPRPLPIPAGPPADALRMALREVADLHRGEQVLILGHPGLPGRPLPVRVEIGDDGLFVHPWPQPQTDTPPDARPDPA